MDEWHATRLVDHVLHLLGKLILISLAVSFLVGLLAGITGDLAWLYVAGVVTSGNLGCDALGQPSPGTIQRVKGGPPGRRAASRSDAQHPLTCV
jgi:hypothetical protein